jgi:hypothetical protein
MMNWKGFGRKLFGLILEFLEFGIGIWNFPEGAEENYKNSCQDNLSPGRDLNPGNHEYEAGMLTTPT